MEQAVDYELAARTAARLAPAGPALTRPEAQAVVTELRDLTVLAEQHVRTVTGLEGQPGPATVVDRADWARANVEGFAVVLDPITARLRATRQNPLAARATATLAGVQMGSVLSWMSTKVLGQYEALTADGRPGRLLLVAPNVVETEQRLGVVPRDFRLWVALHEVTHRTQFTAVPWLHGHVRGEVEALMTAARLDDPQALLARLKDVVTGLPRGGSLVELLQTPEQRVVLERVTAFMSLLEGHAEHVMDGVGPSVVPTVRTIRRRFDERRKDTGGLLDRVLRRVLGMDLKALQYAEGKRFVDAVVGRVGMDGLNRVWEEPDALPTRGEVRAPLEWVRRVHGPRALPA